MPPRRTRAPRTDAVRNRARVLEVAEAVFSTEGLAVPIDDIARRARLGIGTVYRHFPTKQHLIAAIVHDRMMRLADEAIALAAAPDPETSFFGFLDRLAHALARKRDLGEALAGVDMKAATEEPRAKLRTGVAALLRRAQQAGAVRDELVVDDVIALVAATLPAPGRPSGSPARLLAVVLDGMRPPAVRGRKPAR